MKCVGLLIFVLLVQSVDKFLKEKQHNWKYSSGVPTIPTPTANVQTYRDFNYDAFRSRVNGTEGILIPTHLMLTVPLSDISLNVLTSFRSLQQTLSDISGCELKMVSSVATGLLELLNGFADSVGSDSLHQKRSTLSDVIPGIFLSITNVIPLLNLGTRVSDGVEKIKTNLLAVIQVLDANQSSGPNVTKQLNDAVFPMILTVQAVIVAIGVVAEKVASKIGNVSVEAKETVLALALVLQTIIVVVQSINTSIASTVDRIAPTSSALNSYLFIVDRSLPSISSVISSITSSSVASSASLLVSTISVTLTTFTNRLNESINKLLTSVVLEIPDRLESIFLKLIDSETDFAHHITTSAATVTSSLSEISSSDAGMQSKVARQVYPIFYGLVQLTDAASDSDILSSLSKSLPSMLESVKAAANNLVYGIGLEITKSFVTSIENTFAALQKMLDMLNQEVIIPTEMDDVTIELAKAVQIFGSIVVAVTTSVSGTFGSASTDEAVISLPLLHTTVLYVAEWVTVVASSAYLTKVQETGELVSSLAATIVIILKRYSNVVELIAASASQNSSEVVKLIEGAFDDLRETAAALNNISKVSADTSVKIEKMSSGGNDVTVAGINDEVEGNLSQILNGLTGSLGDISSTFSASLSSLANSLNQISSSNFDLLNVISGALISITTNLSNISGSATRVMHLTSNALSSIFGSLLEATSRMGTLGEIIASLGASFANVSSALHALFYSVSDYKVTACFVIDAVRELAKTVQIVIATFAAIVNAAAETSIDILNQVSHEIAAIAYLVSTIVLVVQQVVGVAIPMVVAKTGTIFSTQHELTLSISSMLEHLTSITSVVTDFVNEGTLTGMVGSISDSVSNLQEHTSSTLSKISGVLANFKVTLGMSS